ncbi:MAG: TlpA family protein disulfide reductase [Lachnospiraceae bacterium]|nr:TlpA family protein disulfide reductase [Lachnospiraceae bacterium]
MKRKKALIFAAVLSTALLTACSGDFLSQEYPLFGGSEEEFETEWISEPDEEPDTAKPTEADKPKDSEKPSEDPEPTKADKPEFKDRANATSGVGRPKELSEGDVAPDFTVELISGEMLTLSDYDDRVVLLNFWATWCPPCVGEMPALQKLYEEMGDEVLILGVDCAESRRDVTDFVNENGYTYPIALDEDYTVGYYYPSDGIPYTLIIDHGVIADIFVGANGADAMYREYSNAINACK